MTDQLAEDLARMNYAAVLLTRWMRVSQGTALNTDLSRCPLAKKVVSRGPREKLWGNPQYRLWPIRNDIRSEELQGRRATVEPAPRLIAIANALEGMDRANARSWPGWTARPCVTGFIATMRKELLGCAIGQPRAASRS